MSYKITIQDCYLELSFRGQTSLDENISARNEILESLNLNEISSVLVDMSGADLSKVSLEDLYEFGKSWNGLLLIENTKFATLVPENNPFRAKIDLSHIVGAQQGVKLKIFESKLLAEKWLST